MNSDNKQIRDVADVAARIMAGLPITEKLHPNQQKLDVHEPEKDELTSDDFKKLRAGKKADVKKEEVESIDEADLLAKRDKPNDFGTRPGLPQGKNLLKVRMKADQGKHTKPNLPEEVELDEKISISYKVPTDNENFGAKPGDTIRFPKSPNITRKMQLHRDVTAKAVKSIRAQGGNPANHPDIKINKEEVELDEVKMADLPSTKVQGRAYGASKPEPHALDLTKGPKDKELKNIDAEKKKKFSEMVNLYQNGGMKSFMEALSKEEEEKIIDEVSKEIADYTMDVIDAGEYTEVTIGEEASQEEFNAEIEKAKAKSQGKIKAEVAKGAVQAVKQEGTEITDEMIFEVLENAGIDFESLDDDELQIVANEAYEILDELSKNTLGSYLDKKKSQYMKGKTQSGSKENAKDIQNMGKAYDKMKKENVELGEDNMNSAEMEKREKIVKGMKKGMEGFKERYGARAKNVMYATATKRAMEK